MDSDEELPPAPLPVARPAPVDNVETQAFVLDTQMVLQPIFEEEQKTIMESPPSVVRKLFLDEDKGAGDKGAEEPSAPAAPASLEELSPKTNPTPSPLPTEHKFLEFSPPKVPLPSNMFMQACTVPGMHVCLSFIRSECSRCMRSHGRG